MLNYGGPDNLSAVSALNGAADWISALLTGSLAFTIATIGIAGIGFMMLGGRTPVRRTAQIIFGCFILFSAPVIAEGLVGLEYGSLSEASSETSAPLAPSYQPTVPRLEQKDPFAGAAVPPPEHEILQ